MSMSLFWNLETQALALAERGKQVSLIQTNYKYNGILKTIQVDFNEKIVLTTKWGHSFEIETPRANNWSPIEGRKVVYLDQKDWSLFSLALSNPTEVSEKEREACFKLADLVKENKIILPFSMAHFMETYRWAKDERRNQLAAHLFEFSKGWQMVNPVEVRLLEIKSTFRDDFTPLNKEEVFSLAPYSLESNNSFLSPLGLEDLPEEVQASSKQAIALVGTIETLMEEDRTFLDKNTQWAEANQAFTKNIHSGDLTQKQIKAAIDLMFMQDIGTEAVNAVMQFERVYSLDEFKKWVMNFIKNDLPKTPTLALHREIYQDKHRNAKITWSPNDLIDTMYMTVAASYADYLVGERSLTHYLKNGAARYNRSSNHIFKNIVELIEELK